MVVVIGSEGGSFSGIIKVEVLVMLVVIVVM